MSTESFITDEDPTIVADGRYIVTYDLPCEHRSIFEDNEVARKAVQNTRWKAGEWLHSLGLQATQSQIFVAPTKNLDILTIKQRVKAMYTELENQLARSIPDVELHPIIVVTALQGAMQLGQFTYLVQQSLITRLDTAIRNANTLIENLDGHQLDDRQVHRLHYRLPNDIQEWQTIQQMAEAFGIDTSNVRFMIDLLQQAQTRT